MNSVQLYVDGKYFKCELKNEELETLQAHPSKVQEFIATLQDGQETFTADDLAEGEPSGKEFVSVWDDKATRLLLKKVALYMPDVGLLKKFTDKKSMRAAIAAEVETVARKKRTALQCENCFKTVKNYAVATVDCSVCP
ncbi:hypothetical protein V5799_020341 [Amblyomma americanum]|uniref:Uncharacterized protein n=1 Tax=Amblyomma americanum TaxID=6943 RepID=A0AAQ4EUR6_AMBAM